MKFLPINKTLLVKPIEEKVSDLVPEELRQKSPFIACEILDRSSDLDNNLRLNTIVDGVTPTFRIMFKTGSLIVVRTEGLEEIKFKGEIYTIVSEKFVVGELTDES